MRRNSSRILGVYSGMFEQSLVMETGTNRPWTVMLGLTGQVLVVGLAVLIPLIYTERLPAFSFIDIHVPAPPHPLGPHIPEKTPADGRRVIHQTARPFDPKTIYQPPRIPQQINILVDDLPAVSSDIQSLGQFSNGPYTRNSVVDSIGRYSAPVAPPPPHAATPKTAETVAHAPIRVSTGVQEAKIIRRVMPVYPVLAKQARVSGKVELLGIIGTDGSIQRLKVLSGHPLLIAAAVDAVRQWVYKPTLLNGQPVEVIAPILVTFTLGQ